MLICDTETTTNIEKRIRHALGMFCYTSCGFRGNPDFRYGYAQVRLTLWQEVLSVYLHASVNVSGHAYLMGNGSEGWYFSTEWLLTQTRLPLNLYWLSFERV